MALEEEVERGGVKRRRNNILRNTVILGVRNRKKDKSRWISVVLRAKDQISDRPLPNNNIYTLQNFNQYVYHEIFFL